MNQRRYKSKDESFFSAFTREIYQSLGNNYRDNYDELRFGPQPTGLLSVIALFSDAIKKYLKRNGFRINCKVTDTIKDALDFVSPSLTRLERLNDILADQESKDLLVKLVAFRILGHRKVRLPFNASNFRRGLEGIESLISKSDSVDPNFMDWTLNRIDLTALGMPVSLYSSPLGVNSIFLAEQYRCSSETCIIEAAPGNYVIDGGGCWGDTALYFASKVGEKGRVFTFEFVPLHLGIIRKNLDLNPQLKPRIDIVERAMWSRSGEMISYIENGPGTRISDGINKGAKASAQTMSIDDLVALNGLQRIDFIKMDIEGAEITALKGAKNTLQRFKPKLAICVYHNFEDIFDVPEYLDSLNLNYSFYLRHFTIHLEETILYAQAD